MDHSRAMLVVSAVLKKTIMIRPENPLSSSDNAALF